MTQTEDYVCDMNETPIETLLSGHYQSSVTIETSKNTDVIIKVFTLSTKRQ